MVKTVPFFITLAQMVNSFYEKEAEKRVREKVY